MLPDITIKMYIYAMLTSNFCYITYIPHHMEDYDFYIAVNLIFK